MYGGQASLEVGIAAALLATVFGTLYGAVSGYVGGALDAVMMRLVDGLLAMPALFLLLVLATIYSPGTGVMILLIAALSWLGAARLIRGEALSLRVREYVQAVRLMGGSNTRAVVRHIAPNAIGTVVVFASFKVADSILTLSFLGFLGLGLQPPQTNWGGMLSTATIYINSGYWWLLYPPGSPSCWSRSPSTSWATRCATRSRSGCRGGELTEPVPQPEPTRGCRRGSTRPLRCSRSPACAPTSRCTGRPCTPSTAST